MKKTPGSIFILVVVCMLTIGVVGKPATSSAQPAKVIQWMAQVQDASGTNFYKSFDQFCKDIAVATNGRLVIKLNPGGAIVPAMQEFDGVSKHVLDYASMPSIYWQSKWPEAGLFCFQAGGLSSMEMLYWYQYGGGLDLMNKMIAGKNVVLIPAFFAPASVYAVSNRELKSLADMKGLKIRTSGDNAAILAAMGASIITISSNEVYEAMQRRVLDAALIGSAWDNSGFKVEEVTKYWYLSPSARPSTNWCDGVNADAWNALPDDIKMIVKDVAFRTAITRLGRHSMEDAKTIETVKKKGVIVKSLPEDIEEETYRAAEKFYREKSAKDPKFAEVYNSIQAFKKTWRDAVKRL